MFKRSTLFQPCLDPNHWAISRKVAAAPVVIIILLGLVVFSGWSMTSRHQLLMDQNYKEQIAYEGTVLRLPHILASIQKDLYKLTIWAQIGVQGIEVTSTEEAIHRALDEVGDIVADLEGLNVSTVLEDSIRRYDSAVTQALVLIARSPALGATATRGMEHVYVAAEKAVDSVVASAHALFDQRLQDTKAAWQRMVVRFWLMIGSITLLIPVFVIGSDRMIAAPIKQLARVVDKFRAGQLDVEIPWATRQDEIGLVARAMEAFRTSLIRNQVLERERQQLNQELERKVEERTQELAEQKERLAAALEKEHRLSGLQRQFVAMVCHEFRTPLAIIDGNAQRILRKRWALSADRLTTAIGKIRMSVTRLTDLMESVLSASKLEAGAIQIDLAPCNLAEMINEVASNYREVHPSYDIEVDLGTLPAQFNADIKLIRQAVSNLVSNAVKYSPDGAEVHIRASSLPDGDIEIAVEDQGVGIPAGELDQLFVRFFRASTSTGIAGTGIGLHMVKAIIDMHGGRIDVASNEGVGTTFSIRLPKDCEAAMTVQQELPEVA